MAPGGLIFSKKIDLSQFFSAIASAKVLAAQRNDIKKVRGVA